LDVTFAAKIDEMNALAVEVFPPEPHDLAITLADCAPLPPDRSPTIGQASQPQKPIERGNSPGPTVWRAPVGTTTGRVRADRRRLGSISAKSTLAKYPIEMDILQKPQIRTEKKS